MRFPYPLDNCECRHYRISHDTKTGSGKTTCTACTCAQFSLKQSYNEQSEVQIRA